MRAGGTAACSLSAANTWANFCDLQVTFSLSAPRLVDVSYLVAMDCGACPSHLVTRLVVDGAEPQPYARAITGNTQYWNPQARWAGTLGAGSHTVTVQYRTPSGGTNNPGGNDWHTRSLVVLVYGS